MQKTWMALVAGVMVAVLADPVGAAVLCQRKKRVKTRAEQCKGKEVQIQDLGALDQLFQVECAGEPGRELVVGTPPFLYSGYECEGGCRAFDGDQAGCEGKYQLTWYGPTGCVYLDDKCVPCKDCGEAAGRCIDVCEPKTCADATRRDFRGGPNIEACRDLATQGECEAAWAMQYGRRPVSCYWDVVGTTCRGCGESNEGNGNCTNTCRAANECTDPARSFAGYCDMFNGDETACNAAYARGRGSSDPADSCYYDAATSRCRQCDTVHDLLGRCTDSCAN